MNARQHVLSILEKFDFGRKDLDLLIDEIFDNKEIDRRDKRLVFEIIYGIMRNRTYLEYVVTQFLDNKDHADNKNLMRILTIGAYQILYLDKIPDHAAVNEAVHMAKNGRRTASVSGVVNAVLRSIITDRKKLNKIADKLPLQERLSVIYSHPVWLVKRWLETFGLSNTKKLLEYNNMRPSVFYRKSLRERTQQQFEADVFEFCETGKDDHGYRHLYYRVTGQVQPDLLQVFTEGQCTIQSPSSGWVVALMDCIRGNRILDLCAAPGGKTSLMAELVGKEGSIIACDIDASRMKKVRDTYVRMRLRNILCVVCDGRNLPFKCQFDKVLLDAPCSGTGVMQRHPEARWVKNIDSILAMAKLQTELLDSVCQSLNFGGILVYSTCSLEPEENSGQIDSFLKRHPGWTKESPLPLVKQVYTSADGYLQITPHVHKLDGMFGARLRRMLKDL